MWHSNRYFERKIAHAHQHMLSCVGAAANILCADYLTDADRDRMLTGAMRTAEFARTAVDQWLDAYAAHRGDTAAAA